MAIVSVINTINVIKMNKPNMLEFTADLAVAVSDYYEYSMVYANILEGILGRPSVFDVIVRKTPTNKVVGNFEHDCVKYDKLEKRKFLVNAGLEQCAAYFLEGKGNARLRQYLEQVQGITDKRFLDWAESISFQGDVYAMPEGTIFFAQEHQMRVHERFEEAQVFEGLLLCTLNPQTGVATTANDIAEVVGNNRIVTEEEIELGGKVMRVLLEGGLRRGGSPQGAMFNSRAARIGGFSASSNVAFGMNYGEKVGGTHSHSYVMLHPTDYDAFKAQVELFNNNACFLLDTYNVKEAFETAMQIVAEEKLKHFAFRIDSGDLLAQAKWIHERLNEIGYERSAYTLVASDDLTAGKIAKLEEEGADIDKYLVGTYVVNPPKPVTAVYKLAAYQNDSGEWIFKGKLSEEKSKSTLPGIKQVYRIAGSDGYYKRDVVTFEGEDITKYMEDGDTVEPLLVPIIVNGKQVYDFPQINEISGRRKTQLSRFRDIENYEVVVSDSVLGVQREIMREHGMAMG